MSGHQQLTSCLNVPKCQKMFPMAIIKISSRLNMEAQLLCRSLCYYTAKILKKCIMYIYWAISYSNQRTSDFQVSSTSKNERDASVSWLWSNWWLLLSHQSSVVWQTIDSSLFCSYNEMNFKYYVFWSFVHILISMIRSPGLRISSFSTSPSVQISVFIGLCSCAMKTKQFDCAKLTCCI